MQTHNLCQLIARVDLPTWAHAGFFAVWQRGHCGLRSALPTMFGFSVVFGNKTSGMNGCGCAKI